MNVHIPKTKQNNMYLQKMKLEFYISSTSLAVLNHISELRTWHNIPSLPSA